MPTQTLSPPPVLLATLYNPEYEIPDWLYSVLGLHNPAKHHALRPWYDWLTTEALKLPGSVAEFGVYRGDSLLTAAVLLRRAAATKKLFGYDSFSGPLTNTDADTFHSLEKQRHTRRISREHFEHARQLRGLEDAGLAERNTFKQNSLEDVQQRIVRFGLSDWVVLVPGHYEHTLQSGDGVQNFCGVLIDCNMYQSTKLALQYAWPRLVHGGIAYLDDYYSLKFPGAREAIDEFCANNKLAPQRVLGITQHGEFERWLLYKR